MKPKVLIVDDDPNIRELLALYLEKEGYDCHHAADGDSAIEQAKMLQPVLILLDIMLPKKDGWQVIREIRKTLDVPVIMITAKGEEPDKITGLEIGADDYVTKPFSTKELMARIKAVMRRSQKVDLDELRQEMRFGNLYMNLAQRVVLLDDLSINLTPKETELIWFLAKNSNRVYSREQLLENVWGYEYFGDARTVDVHVKRLREKLNVTEPKGWTIKTVWGIGYKFEVTDS
ncbi:Transcriptional regulatory protein SrrA [bioreactor metagenome]|mgnify:FL=1|uniref:Transcriptional regulatory protein SrrA n=1 Tax=bioreactor metagenome TaxID=1076179 RepID=A0A645FWI7_9ZZZZ